jgi:hypothetical protein
MARKGQRVIRIIKMDGENLPCDGRYIVKYDPTLVDGVFTLETSPNVEDAIGFDSFVEMRDYWMQVCPDPATRPDGLPNRPLTAFTVSLETV